MLMGSTSYSSGVSTLRIRKYQAWVVVGTCRGVHKRGAGGEGARAPPVIPMIMNILNICSLLINKFISTQTIQRYALNLCFEIQIR